MKKLTLTALLLASPLWLGIAASSPAIAQEATAQASAESAQGVETAAGEQADVEGRTLADWYGLGGWVMHVLVVFSVLVLFLLLERTLALRRNAVIPRKFMAQVMGHWKKREIAQVIALCGASDVSIARVLRAGLIHFDQGLARMEDAIASAGEHEATLLRRNLGLLGALGNIATMMGLLGTVLGMIESFDIIAKTGTGDAREVAGGIFKALITTAAGLMVGITAVGAHAHLRRKVEVLEIDLEETSFRLLEELNLERDDEADSAAGDAARLSSVEA